MLCKILITMENNTIASIHATEFPWRFLFGVGLFALGGTM